MLSLRRADGDAHLRSHRLLRPDSAGRLRHSVTGRCLALAAALIGWGRLAAGALSLALVTALFLMRAGPRCFPVCCLRRVLLRAEWAGPL